MKNEIVEKTIRDLVGDYERTGEKLSQEALTKIFVKRELSVDESSNVIEELMSQGIPVEWGELNDDDIELIDETVEAGSSSNFSFINRYNLLTKEDEVKLGRTIKLAMQVQDSHSCDDIITHKHLNIIVENGRKAKEAMVLANLRLVRKVVSYFSVSADLTVEDLFQEGIIGLSRAVEKFDPDLGFKFSTYAVWWIKQAIERAIVDKGLTIRVPVHMHNKVQLFKKAVSALSAIKNGKSPKPYEVAEELNWSVEEVHFCWAISAIQPSSLDELKHDGEYSLKDFLVADIPSPEDEINSQELTAGIKEHLAILKDREIEVLAHRFGLSDNQEERTLEYIGEMFGVTRERIRQIEAEALKKLRRPSSASVLQENFLDD
ncbi:RNA polymerase sigma factor, RpoD/SigA family [Vibrio fluvialis]|uniref:RNA polymerase sigma factor RpoD n=1 Tax=Vibrio fluvialis TaxID=676 RepID=A0AAX2LRC0_VIBFL|nr:sigma-70 family RNA polymerase sigma factor [Vibrio fluvialis]AMF95364.1 RNA polymerase sigma factor, RpoD/SigA family [Vibrio fluvialis]EKO4010725.1 sigma-70 family RNA polymerase sigma factor [Vibrio fluvialis]MBY8226497.1 sigma-70 family RNA polymerase sigma factor [Vibrio fluvialis]MCE7633428.1 sigma-70 family RNA polymerase sigma factor [Vibrio fluvialis]MCE7637884.1 sigma-70 family RNA polymerase sigma factor [Vibrio fluvialis]